MKEPLYRGKSCSSKSSMTFKNLLIAKDSLENLFRLLKNLTTLKSPRMHQGSCDKPLIAPSSSQKSSLCLRTEGPYTPVKTQKNHPQHFLTSRKLKELQFPCQSALNTLLSQKTNTPLPFPENSKHPTPKTCPPPKTEPNYTTDFGTRFLEDKPNMLFEP